MSVMMTCITMQGFCQTSEIDSLKLEIDQQPSDTAKIRALYDLTYKFLGFSLDSALNYARKCYELGMEVEDPGFRCISNSIMGTTFLYLNHYDSAGYYYERALAITKQHDIPDKASALYTNMGVLYKRQGQYDKAIEQYLEGLAIDDVNDNYYEVFTPDFEFYRLAGRRLADELEGEAELTAMANAVIARAGQPSEDGPLLMESERTILAGSEW